MDTGLPSFTTMPLPLVYFENAWLPLTVVLHLGLSAQLLRLPQSMVGGLQEGAFQEEVCEHASPLQARARNPRTSFPSHSIGQSNHRARFKG